MHVCSKEKRDNMRPPPLSSLSIDQLVDIEFSMKQTKNDSKDNKLQKLIDVQKELYSKLSRDRESEYYSSLEKIKKDLIFNLVHYGSYLKTEYRKDDIAAQHAFKQLLMYDRENPIAHYRLGFLSYKRKIYFLAIMHFQNALRHHGKGTESQYSLNKQQQYNATLYLSNSALHIATQAHESLENFNGDVEENPVNLELSPVYSIIAKQEDQLQNNTYKILTIDSETYGSIDDCEKIIDDRDNEMVILYFSDYEIFIYHGDSHTNIPVSRANLLKALMLHSNKESPLTQDDLRDEIGDLLPDTFIHRDRK